MAKPRDYYEVLGVQRDADDVELKRAYRALALRYHPDHNQNDKDAEERFKEVAAAYAVLSDSEKRMRYHRLGHVGLATVGSSEAMGLDLDTVKEFFESVVGDLIGRRKGRSAGRDLRYTIDVAFKEAALGAQKTITVPVRVPCDGCQGTGARGGEAGLRVCRTCAGKGENRVPGFLPVHRSCGPCRGTGKEIVDACPACRGSAQMEERREFVVTIPAGCEEGTMRRLAGQGEPGLRGGAPGDLTVVMRLVADPLLRREGALVHCDLPLTFVEAALGCDAEVPTLEGIATLKIAPGTQSGTVLRLKGKGAKTKTGVRGDLHVKILVETPQEPDEVLRAQLNVLGARMKPTVHPQRQRFLAALDALHKKTSESAD